MSHKARQLVLHIGLAKTGTSALQRELFQQRHILLAEHGILYLGFHENHYYLQAMFSAHPESLVQIQVLGLKDRAALDRFLNECRQKVLDEVASSRPERIIVSSEYFSGMTVDELKAMRAFLQSIAEEVSLLAYVRDPWSFSYSLIQEMIRSGSLDHEVTVGYSASNIEIFEKFEEAFKCDLTVVPYCVGKSQINVIADFARRLGIPQFCCEADSTAADGVNRAMSREAASVMLHLNRLYPTFDKEGKYLPDSFRDWSMEVLQEVRNGTTRFALSRSTAERIFREAKPDIEILESKYFGGQRAFTELFASLTFEEFDDALTLSSFSPTHLVEFMLAGMRKLSDRAIYFHEHMLINSTERSYWDGKCHALVGDVESARQCFEEVLGFKPDHAEALSEMAALNALRPEKPALVTPMKKAVIVGATGYIGRALLEEAAKSLVTVGTSSSGSNELMALDLAAPETFDYDAINRGDVVFLTAAISSPDVCAKEHARAWRVNVTGTTEFIHRVTGRGGRVIFFSSDTIYGERAADFDELAYCNPAGEYASMKQEVERRFLGNPLFKSIRLSYVFSRDDKFTRYLSHCAYEEKEAEIFHPFYRAVVHRDDVVQAAIALAQNWDGYPHRTINFGGPEIIARSEYAEILRDVAMPSLRFRVVEPEAGFFHNRPKVIRMTSPLLAELLGRPMHTLREAVELEFMSD